MAQCFASRQLPGRQIELREIPIPALSLPRHAPGPRACLAVVPTRCSANEFLTIRELAMALQARRSPIDILVAGSTIDDERLMSHPNVFVTGPVDLPELNRVLAPHDVRWMLTGFDQALFGHPVINAVRGSSLPVAFLDWSFGALPGRSGDLAISPETPRNRLTGQLVSWMEDA